MAYNVVVNNLNVFPNFYDSTPVVLSPCCRRVAVCCIALSSSSSSSSSFFYAKKKRDRKKEKEKKKSKLCARANVPIGIKTTLRVLHTHYDTKR
jgi:hypothetical protein